MTKLLHADECSLAKRGLPTSEGFRKLRNHKIRPQHAIQEDWRCARKPNIKAIRKPHSGPHATAHEATCDSKAVKGPTKADPVPYHVPSPDPTSFPTKSPTKSPTVAPTKADPTASPTRMAAKGDYAKVAQSTQCAIGKQTLQTHIDGDSELCKQRCDENTRCAFILFNANQNPRCELYADCAPRRNGKYTMYKRKPDDPSTVITTTAPVGNMKPNDGDDGEGSSSAVVIAGAVLGALVFMGVGYRLRKSGRLSQHYSANKFYSGASMPRSDTYNNPAWKSRRNVNGDVISRSVTLEKKELSFRSRVRGNVNDAVNEKRKQNVRKEKSLQKHPRPSQQNLNGIRMHRPRRYPRGLLLWREK